MNLSMAETIKNAKSSPKMIVHLLISRPGNILTLSAILVPAWLNYDLRMTSPWSDMTHFDHV